MNDNKDNLSFHELFASYGYPIAKCEWDTIIYGDSINQIITPKSSPQIKRERLFIIQVIRDGWNEEYRFKSVRQALVALKTDRMQQFWIPF